MISAFEYIDIPRMLSIKNTARIFFIAFSSLCFILLSTISHRPADVESFDISKTLNDKLYSTSGNGGVTVFSSNEVIAVTDYLSLLNNKE